MSPLSLLSFLILLILLLTRPAFSSDSLRLSLIRIPPDPPQTRTDRIRDLIRNDRSRHRYISASIRHKNCVGSSPSPAPPLDSFAMPISSGAYTGTGQYFVRVRVGTPAQRFLLVADTGSDLTWVDCEYTGGKSRKGRPGGLKRVFEADRSRSFHPIPCSSDMCMTQLPFSLATCPVPTAPCEYNYGYGINLCLVG